LGNNNVPKDLENKLKKQAAKKHLSGEERDAYIYGTMRRTGWRPRKR